MRLHAVVKISIGRNKTRICTTISLYLTRGNNRQTNATIAPIFARQKLRPRLKWHFALMQTIYTTMSSYRGACSATTYTFFSTKLSVILELACIFPRFPQFVQYVKNDLQFATLTSFMCMHHIMSAIMLETYHVVLVLACHG